MAGASSNANRKWVATFDFRMSDFKSGGDRVSLYGTIKVKSGEIEKILFQKAKNGSVVVKLNDRIPLSNNGIIMKDDTYRVTIKHYNADGDNNNELLLDDGADWDPPASPEEVAHLNEFEGPKATLTFKVEWE